MSFINMSHQLVVKTRLGETQIGLVVLDILNSTVGWCSHIGIFWELKHVETTDIKSHNSSHMGLFHHDPRVNTGETFQFFSHGRHSRAVAAKPCWLIYRMISQFMKWESLWKSARIKIINHWDWCENLGFQPYLSVIRDSQKQHEATTV